MSVRPADPITATRMTLPQLEGELLTLAGHLAAAQCRFLRLLVEFDERNGWAGPGLKSCAHWLSWRIGMSLRTAHEHLRVARALRELPAIDEAFAAGKLSYSKVRAITRVHRPGVDDPEPPAPSTTPTDPAGPDATETAGAAEPTGAADPAAAAVPAAAVPAAAVPAAAVPAAAVPAAAVPAAAAPATVGRDDSVHSPPPDDAEQALLALALAGTASHVETVVRAARRQQHDPTRIAAQRSLSWRWADDGSLILHARLTADEGATLIAAIDELAAPLRTPVQHPVPAAPEGWRERMEEEHPGAVTDRVAARRADALLQLTTNSGAASGTPATVLRGQARVVVHIDATEGTAALAGGPEIPISTAERLACDAQAKALLQDTTHNRLYLGRDRRLASPAQIVAITVRDGGRCQFPGCTHTHHLDAHHVVSWLRGGRTDVDNLLLLCGFHHTLVHDRGYAIRRNDGAWEVRRPSGAEVPTGGSPLTGNVERLIESHTRAAIRITPAGLTPTWAGERLDPAPILQRLLPHRAHHEAAA